MDPFEPEYESVSSMDVDPDSAFNRLSVALACLMSQTPHLHDGLSEPTLPPPSLEEVRESVGKEADIQGVVDLLEKKRVLEKRTADLRMQIQGLRDKRKFIADSYVQFELACNTMRRALDDEEEQIPDKDAVRKKVDILLETCDARLDSLSPELDEASSKLHVMARALLAVAIEAGHEDHAATCPVCYDARVEVVFIPCGHTICRKCYDKMVAKRQCSTCRTDVHEIVRLFF